MIDSVDSGRNSEIDDIITSLSPLISKESQIFKKELSHHNRQFWTTVGLLTVGVIIIGGITALRIFKN